MSLTAPEIRTMARGSIHAIDIDWGENTAGEETGVLKSGDTVSSCVVAVDAKPSGAADPTLGAVSVPGSSLIVNGRTCTAGEATTCMITTAADQAYGNYRLKFTTTTANAFVLPRFVNVIVKAN